VVRQVSAATASASTSSRLPSSRRVYTKDSSFARFVIRQARVMRARSDMLAMRCLLCESWASGGALLGALVRTTRGGGGALRRTAS
jgi:hypothetical protein